MLRQFHRQLIRGHSFLLSVSKEAVYQCTKDCRYTVYFVLDSLNSRYLCTKGRMRYMPVDGLLKIIYQPNRKIDEEKSKNLNMQ